MRLRLFPPEQSRFDHRRLPCLPRAKNSVTVHGCKGVGEGRDIRRPPGECRSALKSVEYAPRVLFKSPATTLSHSNLGQSAVRNFGERTATKCRELSIPTFLRERSADQSSPVAGSASSDSWFDSRAQTVTHFQAATGLRGAVNLKASRRE